METKISEYAKTNEDIDRFASFTNQKYEEFGKAVEGVQKFTMSLNTTTTGILKKQLFSLPNQINQLNEKIDELEQYSRRKCVKIKGIPFSESENTDALVVYSCVDENFS